MVAKDSPSRTTCVRGVLALSRGAPEALSRGAPSRGALSREAGPGETSPPEPMAAPTLEATIGTDVVVVPVLAGGVGWLAAAGTGGSGVSVVIISGIFSGT